MKSKKIINIIIGTNNLGKLREIKDLLPKSIKIYSPKNLKLKSPKENGISFKENSMIKAKYFSKKTKMICLADDSGLEIDILNKKPGIFSSRWSGPKNNFNIAIKNLFGAKLRTGLNVFVTSISFFLVIFVSGMYDGMREYAKNTTIETEVAGGTYWHPDYDSMDPRTFEDSHSIIPTQVRKLIDQKNAFGVLVSQASIYPNGRIMPVIMKGITPDQNIVNMPTEALQGINDGTIPVLIGKGMAKDSKLKVGDSFTIR